MFKGAVLFSVLLLSGCTEEFASLRFGESTQKKFVAEGYVSYVSYREILLDELAKIGVSVDQLEVVTDKRDSRVLNLSFKSRSFDAGQRALVRGYLERQLADRKASSYSATLQLYPEKSKPGDARHVTETRRFQTVPIRIEPRGEPKTLITYFRRGLPGIAVEDEMQCNFAFPLQDPLYFQALKLFSNDVERAEVESGTGVWVRYRASSEELPARLVFDDANLTRLIDEGEADIHMVEVLAGKISEFSFMIDGLSSGTHTNGGAEIGIYYDLHRQCNELIGALGRPFSFHMGGGMDRLISVTYKKPD